MKLPTIGSKVRFNADAVIWFPSARNLHGKLATVVRVEEISNPYEDNPPTTIVVEIRWEEPPGSCFNRKDPVWNIGAWEKGWFVEVPGKNDWEDLLELE